MQIIPKGVLKKKLHTQTLSLMLSKILQVKKKSNQKYCLSQITKMKKHHLSAEQVLRKLRECVKYLTKARKLSGESRERRVRRGLPHIHSQLPNSAGGATTPSHMLSAYPFLTATKSESQYFFLKDLKEIGVGSLFS